MVQRIVPLRGIDGVVVISGAKNSSLLLLAASALATDKVVLRNIPMLADVEKMCAILNTLNIKTTWLEERVLEIDPREIQYNSLDINVCGEIRTSVLFMGVLLGRFGKVCIQSPGGCSFGPRPINFHIDAMRAMGASIQDDGDLVFGELSGSQNAVIHFGKVSVTGLVNALFCAVTRDAETVIHNCAQEPEVEDCIEFLTKLGADIRRKGLTVVVRGGNIGGGVVHDVIPDRIEAGTFLILATMLGGRLVVENVKPKYMGALLEKLREAGASIQEGVDSIVLEMSGRPRACDIVACPYPGFPTDLQPQWCALASISQGISKITDTIYPSRFDHMVELESMGVKYHKFEQGVVIIGVDALNGAKLTAKNLRSAAALVLAAKVAKSSSVVENSSHLYRGYYRFFEKLDKISSLETL